MQKRERRTPRVRLRYSRTAHFQCRAARDHSWIEIEVPSPIAVVQDCEAVAASRSSNRKVRPKTSLILKSLPPVTEGFEAEESLAGLDKTSSYRIYDLANAWL